MAREKITSLDFSSTLKSKFDSVEVGANKYIHPNDISTRHVSDTQISTWNGKADSAHTHSNYMPHVNANGYWGMTANGDPNNWLRVTLNGLLPAQSGIAGAGHGSLGTSSWYFSQSYIDNMFGNLAGSFGGYAIDKFAKAYIGANTVDINDTNLKQVYGTCVTGNGSAPSVDWWHILNIPHEGGNGYGGQLAIAYHGGSETYVRSAAGTTWGAWTKLYSTANVSTGTGAPGSFIGEGNQFQVYV